jgi:hypothetical protein
MLILKDNFFVTLEATFFAFSAQLLSRIRSFAAQD